jgi:hypothetical protein
MEKKKEVWDKDRPKGLGKPKGFKLGTEAQGYAGGSKGWASISKPC